MSQPRACTVLEARPGQWFLLLADREGGDLTPWTASAWGPFDAAVAAEDYIANFTNPGGFTRRGYEAGVKLPGEYTALIAQARKPEVRWDRW